MPTLVWFFGGIVLGAIGAIGYRRLADAFGEARRDNPDNGKGDVRPAEGV